MARLLNRNCIVIELPAEARPIIIGPFKRYGTACDRRDQIIEYLEEEADMTDGTEYKINVVPCLSTSTLNKEVLYEMEKI